MFRSLCRQAIIVAAAVTAPLLTGAPARLLPAQAARAFTASPYCR